MSYSYTCDHGTFWRGEACPCCLKKSEERHVPTEEMREALRQRWYWFDDHDDRKTSAELHDMLRKVVGS